MRVRGRRGGWLRRTTSARSRRRRGAGRGCVGALAKREMRRERRWTRIQRGGRIRSSRLRCLFGGRRQGSRRGTSRFLGPL